MIDGRELLTHLREQVARLVYGPKPDLVCGMDTPPQDILERAARVHMAIVLDAEPDPEDWNAVFQWTVAQDAKYPALRRRDGGAA